MKTMLLDKIARGPRSRTAGHAECSMEFADLLDIVALEPVVAASPVDAVSAEPDLGLADLVMFPVPHRLDPPAPSPVVETVEARISEVVEAPIVEPLRVSRFADAGLDDDLLPVHASGRRFHR